MGFSERQLWSWMWGKKDRQPEEDTVIFYQQNLEWLNVLYQMMDRRLTERGMTEICTWVKLTHRQPFCGLKYLRKSSAAPLQFDWHILISVDCGDQACSVCGARSLLWLPYDRTAVHVEPLFPCHTTTYASPHTSSLRPQKLGVRSIFGHPSTVKACMCSSWQPAGSLHNHAAPTHANNINHFLLGQTILKLKLKRRAGGSENVISDQLSH